MIRLAILLRLALVLSLGLSAFAPHRAHAAGPVMVICGAGGTYTVPMGPAAPEVAAHECCLAACWAALPAIGPQDGLRRTARRTARPGRRRAMAGRRAAARRARGPPARL